MTLIVIFLYLTALCGGIQLTKRNAILLFYSPSWFRRLLFIVDVDAYLINMESIIWQAPINLFMVICIFKIFHFDVFYVFGGLYVYYPFVFLLLMFFLIVVLLIYWGITAVIIRIRKKKGF